ncbi:MAG: MarR family transcriptional regulator [Lachnospiraceae bacterium]|nr:MarR family transcriptional regulator [Lachnospiraceae bacterium]
MERREIGKEIIILSNQLKRRVDHIVASYGLTGVQSRVIRHIYEKSKVCDVYQKDIEDAFEIRRSSVTSVLQLLEKKGFIKRESVSEDARLKKLTLTEQGRKMHESVCNVIEEMEEGFYAALTKEEMEQLFCSIEKLALLVKE